MSVRGATSPKIVSVLLFLLILGAPVWAQAPEGAAALPEGSGKGLVASTCSKCHALSVVTSRKKRGAEWESTVNDMVAKGAQITTDEAKSIAQYLAAHFSPDTPPTPAASGQAKASPFPDLPGKDVFMNKCFQCHNEAMWKTLRQDKKGWEISIYPMVGRGALWTQEEISAMAEYLAAAFGPKAAEKPQTQGRER